MMKYSEKMYKQLNEVLEKTFDAEKGYIKAMSKSKNNKTKMFFKRMTDERAGFAKDLLQEISSYGEKPEQNGSLEGVTHRAWIDMKTVFSKHNEEVILEECLRGEQIAMNEYDEILKHKNDLPPTTVSLLENHRNEIQKAVNKIQLFEEANK
ncbi:PA2169 family four-helix-bundle protein [Zhouia sp. PK063]|uniref:PA2169 family four-helix-bundle protein n=1 Tax=Zhouia sp. PK063 TaxID=3373602 RepID=UPI003789E967